MIPESTTRTNVEGQVFTKVQPVNTGDVAPGLMKVTQIVDGTATAVLLSGRDINMIIAAAKAAGLTNL